MKLQIFQTIGIDCNALDDSLISEHERIGISGFRFNLAKCQTELELKKRINFISQIQQKYPQTQIMLDIPYPGNKIRIKINSVNDEYFVAKNEHVLFGHFHSKPPSKPMTFEVLSHDYLEHVIPSQLISYSDGECYFEVLHVDYNSGILEAKALNNAKLFSEKSINIGWVPHKEVLPSLLLDTIRSINPNYLALSFVNNLHTISVFSTMFSGTNTQLISKIETKEAIDNLNDIASKSAIMIARGDLSLNVFPSLFPKLQDKIAYTANRQKAKLFCATGILRSLDEKNSLHPSQADLNDLYRLLQYNPTGIILNHFRSIDAQKEAVHLIREMAGVVLATSK